MTQVIVDITMSLDGFVTRPNARPGQGLGEDGEILHRWAIGDRSPADVQILDDAVAATGAIVMGRRLFDIVDAPDGWDSARSYGADRNPADLPPIIVLTHAPPASVRLDAPISFVADGIAGAIEQARAAAGDKDVYVMGGGEVIDQCVRAGLADVLSLHISPVLLGGGTRLFSLTGDVIALERISLIDTDAATHLRYRFVRDTPDN